MERAAMTSLLRAPGLMLRLVASCLLGLLAALPAAADACGPPPDTDEVLLARPDVKAAIDAAQRSYVNATGRLYEVGTSPPSYLIGTIHLGGAGLQNPGPQLEAILQDAKTLLVEIDETSLQTAVGMMALDPGRMMRKDGRSFTDTMNAQELAYATEILDSFSIPLETAKRMRPGFLAMSLAIPPCVQKTWPPTPGLDARLERLAKAHDVDVISLETFDEQMDIILGDDDVKADRLLRAVLPYADASAEGIHLMRALYRNGYIAAIWTGGVNHVVDVFGEAEGKALMEEAWEALLTKRNKNMVERASPYLDKGGAVIAVGALHLVGEDGLVALLQKEGLSVSPLPELPSGPTPSSK